MKAYGVYRRKRCCCCHDPDYKKFDRAVGAVRRTSASRDAMLKSIRSRARQEAARAVEEGKWEACYGMVNETEIEGPEELRYEDHELFRKANMSGVDKLRMVVRSFKELPAGADSDREELAFYKDFHEIVYPMLQNLEGVAARVEELAACECQYVKRGPPEGFLATMGWLHECIDMGGVPRSMWCDSCKAKGVVNIGYVLGVLNSL